MELDPAHVAWSKRLWERLNDGGEWILPRSGAKFRREGDRLLHVNGFTTEALFDAIQVKHHFAAFGVEVAQGFPESVLVADTSFERLDGSRRKEVNDAEADTAES